MNNSPLFIYEILGDYSLELTEKTNKPSGYTWRKAKLGDYEIGVHNRKQETHYVASTIKLERKFL